MLEKKFGENVYEHFGIGIVKHKQKQGYILVNDEDGFVYPKVYETEQDAQNYLDQIIEPLLKYILK